VLGALTQTLPPLGLEFNLRKTTFCGPGLVPESSALTAATRLHLEEGTKMLWVPIHSPLYHAPVWTHLGTLATASASPEPTIPRRSSGNWGCPCYQQIARSGRAPVRGAVRCFR